MGDDPAKAISDAVAQRLVAYRLKQGLSQSRLAKLSGLSRTGIRHLESGNTHPTLYSLTKVSKGLRVNLGRIVTEETRRIEKMAAGEQESP